MNDLLSLDSREERTLLIAFADIYGYTGQSRRVPDAELADQLDDYYRLVFDLVSKADGLVVKYIGDSVLSVFDDADAGVNCLLELKHAVDQWLAHRSWRGASLNVKAHYGPLVAGPFGPKGQQRFDIIGTSVNFAARRHRLGSRSRPTRFES